MQSGPVGEWNAALAEADRVFGARLPAFDRPVAGCGRCASPQDLAYLAGPPDEIPQDTLGYFAGEPPDHWDDDQYPVLWRRLMPRFLRYWSPGGGSCSWDFELHHLATPVAGFTDWPQAEQDAVRRAFSALLAIGVTDGRLPWTLAELVGGIAEVTGTARPWLDQLTVPTGPEADAGLVRIAFEWGRDVLWEDFAFDFHNSPELIAEVAAWLPSLRPRIVEFADRHPACKTAADALIALGRLRIGAQSAWPYPRGRDCLPVV